MDGGHIWKPIVAIIIALLVSIEFYDLTNSFIPFALIFAMMLFVAVVAVVIRLVQFL